MAYLKITEAVFQNAVFSNTCKNYGFVMKEIVLNFANIRPIVCILNKMLNPNTVLI